MPCSKAMARYSRLHELQKVGFNADDAGAIIQRSSGHSQSEIRRVVFEQESFIGQWLIKHFVMTGVTPNCFIVQFYLQCHVPFQNCDPSHAPLWLQ